MLYSLSVSQGTYIPYRIEELDPSAVKYVICYCEQDNLFICLFICLFIVVIIYISNQTFSLFHSHQKSMNVISLI